MEQNNTFTEFDNKADEATATVRLQKYFTDCGVLSRRAAEAEIEAGHVKVNGIVATLGQKIDPETDEVTLSGRPVLPPRRGERTTVMLHKPAGFVTTTADDQGRPCVTDLLADLPHRLYPIGRLDMNSTGLLLLTDDGELANLLTHPRHHVPKVYHVTVGGEISPGQLRRLGSPMIIDGYRIRPVKVECLRAYEHKSELQMTLCEGRNRQIRKMCAAEGLHVLSLQRVSLGPILLGHLPEGKFRYLSPSEVEALRNAAIRAADEGDSLTDTKKLRPVRTIRSDRPETLRPADKKPTDKKTATKKPADKRPGAKSSRSGGTARKPGTAPRATKKPAGKER